MKKICRIKNNILTLLKIICEFFMAKVVKILIKFFNRILKVSIFAYIVFDNLAFDKLIFLKNVCNNCKKIWELPKMPSVSKFLKQDLGANVKILLFFHLHRFCKFVRCRLL